MGGRSATSGFTLLETVVALAVASVGIALAAGLLVESHRLAAQAGLEVRAPEVEAPLALLRQELQGASGVAHGTAARRPGAAGSRDRLVLARHDLPPVVYERDGDRLVRRSSEEGEAGDARTVVPDLVSWRWFQAGPNLVTVEVVYDPGAGAPGGRYSPRGRIAAPRAWRTVRLTAALRGGGTTRGW